MISYQHAKGYVSVKLFKWNLLIIDKTRYGWHPIYRKEFRIGKYGIQLIR